MLKLQNKIFLLLLLGAMFFASAAAVSVNSINTVGNNNMHLANDHDMEYLEHWITLGLFTTVLCLSMFFDLVLEQLQHFLKHHKLDAVQNMLNSTYKELTILGFISLTLFSLSRTGFVQKINDKVFGVSKTEAVAIAEAEKTGEATPPPTTLMEVFEEVHIFIFIIMITFVGVAAFLTIIGYNLLEIYSFYDKKTRSDLASDVTEFEQANNGNSNKYSKILTDALIFYGMKQRFLTPNLPVIAAPTQRRQGVVSFSFSMYLKKALGEFLTDLIELPVFTLAFLIFLVLLMRPIMLLSGVSVIFSMIFFSFILFILSAAFMTYFSEVEFVLRPELLKVKLLVYDAIIDYEDESVLIHAPIDDRPLIGKNAMGQLCHRNELIFPLGSPLLTRRILQVLLFLHAAYLAVLFKNITTIAHDSRYLWWKNGLWAYPLTFIPIAASLYCWTILIQKFLFVAYTDCCASAELIQEVENEVNSDELRRDYQLLLFLIHEAHCRIVVNLIKSEEAQNEYETTTSSAYKEDVDLVFSLIRDNLEVFPNKELSGGASLQAVKEAFEALRLSRHQDLKDMPYLVEKWFRTCNIHGGDYIGHDQFKLLIFYFQKLNDTAQMAPDQLLRHLKYMFKQIDTDDDGFISINELCTFWEDVNPPITFEEKLSISRRISAKTEISEAVFTSWANLTLLRTLLY